MISGREWKELGKALAAITLAFGIFIWRQTGDPVFGVLVSLFTVGLGFALHEMAHRYMAFRYRKHAEFRADDRMLVVMILMAAFLPIILAAPGAVVIGGLVSRKEGGIIAAAGPLMNLALALVFLPLIWVVPSVAYYGFMINAFLGLFNMIPLPGFDGQKVIAWSRPAYFAIADCALLLNFLNIMLPNFVNIG